MTVTLEIKPEVEASLTAQARAQGVPLDLYLQNLVEQLALTSNVAGADAQDLRATLDALAEMGKDLPRLPSSAFSRESIYDGKD